MRLDFGAELAPIQVHLQLGLYCPGGALNLQLAFCHDPRCLSRLMPFESWPLHLHGKLRVGLREAALPLRLKQAGARGFKRLQRRPKNWQCLQPSHVLRGVLHGHAPCALPTLRGNGALRLGLQSGQLQ